MRAIDVNLTQLHNAGNDKASEALTTLTQAILDEQALDRALKDELVEQVAFLRQQIVASAQERKPGLIKATLSAIGKTAATLGGIAEAWSKAEPVIRGILGI